MKTVFLILAGLLGGIIAGLGMGGGTLTIPLLVVGLGVGQLTAQAVNLIAFLPTGSAALFIHTKKGLVDFKHILFLILPAMAVCIGTSFFATQTDGELLKKIYGGFLVMVAIGSFFAKTIQIRKIGYLH